MPGFTLSIDQRQRRRLHSLRWLALSIASMLLHFVAFNWANGHLALPTLRDERPRIVTTELLAPPAPPPSVAAPKRRPAPRRTRLPSPEPAAKPAEEIAATPSDIGTQNAGGEAAPEVAPQAVVAETPQEAVAAEPVEAQIYKFDPPPSAELNYDVQALRDGKQWHGRGLFAWEASGDRYSITGEASVTILFKITVLNFRSEGALNGYGVAPVLYSEKPWRKAMTNTHFQHGNQTISFSASQASYPYKGGEQDRASIMWQMAAMGRGDPSRFASGAAFDVMVAGARDAETWRIEVVGLEEIDTGYGTMAAWHVLRAPRQGSYDQRIDFWLAPQQEWYPVRLRYSYPNGDHLEMSLTSIKRAEAR